MKKIIKLLRFVLIAVLILFLGKTAFEKITDRYLPLKYEGEIEKYSAQYGLDEYMVMGVIRAESSFDHKAHSGVARGLMQLTDETAEWIAGKIGEDYHKDMVENPELNIKMGCYYLSYLIKHYGSIDTALAAYNGGMGNVTSWLNNKNYSDDGKTLKDIPYSETKSYVKRVKILWKIYKKLY